MPLIVITGYPSSGKTCLSRKLKCALDALESSDEVNVVHVNDESMGLHPEKYLQSAVEEKKARATLISAVQRHLNARTVVIADSMNYTKSERYQLYCIAREHGTTYCVLHMATSQPDCQLWNQNSGRRLSDDLFVEMCQRYEQPKHYQRWDNPMFIYLPQDLDHQTFSDVSKSILPSSSKSSRSSGTGNAKQRSITKRNSALTPTLATVANTPASSDYLYTMEKCLKSVIDGLMQRQKDNRPLFDIDDDDHMNANENVNFVSVAELSRHKRKFISMHQTLRYSVNNQQMMTQKQLEDSFKQFLKVHLTL